MTIAWLFLARRTRAYLNHLQPPLAIRSSAACLRLSGSGFLLSVLDTPTPKLAVTREKQPTGFLASFVEK
jgi:hypothetical protein